MALKLVVFFLCWLVFVLFDHTNCQLCVQLPVSDCASSSCGPQSSTKGAIGAPGKSGPRGPVGEPGMDGVDGQKGAKGKAGKWGTPDGSCPVVSFSFSGVDQITDYVRYRGYFPNLKSFHMCAWVRSLKDATNSIASYTVDGQDNELLWVEPNLQQRQLHMKGNHRGDFSQSSRSGDKTFVCMSYDSKGEIAISQNVSDTDRSGFEPQLQIQGGGSLIIGQEQDSVGGGFEARQSFRGTITNFMIWPRLLTDQEVHDIAYSCVCPRDYAVAMTMDRVEMYGDVTYTSAQDCPTL